MILLVEVSGRNGTPDMISDSEGVWRYSFGGDETYTDDQGVEFYWSGRRQVFDVRGFVVGSTSYTEVGSVALCRSTVESFYWDDDAKTIYVHHTGSANDYAVGRAIAAIVISEAGYASGRFTGQLSVYPDLYFDPILTAIGGLQKRVDTLKFGLLSFESSDYELANASGRLDGFTLSQSLNSQVIFVLMQKGENDINDGDRIFNGYTGGARLNDERLSVRLSEARVFYNRSVCPNAFTTAAYASIDEQYVGRPIPVAYGDIRRGICVPIDTASFDKATGGTVTFKVADDSLHEILGIDAVYDSDGNEVTAGTISLSACTVQVSIAADSDLDLSRFTWEGQGYDLGALTYNNGLDIMRDVLANQASVVYSASTFDTTQWAAQAAALTQAVGLSIQSDRGLIEEIVEPITVSLQGIVEVLGDGRLTFIPRDPDATISRTIKKDQIVGRLDKTIATDDVVSSIVVEYAPDFSPSGRALRISYDDDALRVQTAYGIASTQPISPVQTVLFESADALAVGEDIASTATDPEVLYRLTLPLDETQIQLLSIIQVDVSRPGDAASWAVCEVLSRTLRLTDGELLVDLQLRVLPDREADFTESWDEGEYSESAETEYTEGEFSGLANAYRDEGEF